MYICNMYDNLLNNKNAEKWNIEEATSLFNKALSIAKDKEDYVIGSGQNIKVVQGNKYHFLGEIATELEIYTDIFKYLKSKYSEVQSHYNRIKTILEANCFSDSKKGIIKEASAIMNLKSNYGWTDRIDNTTQGEKITQIKRTIIDDTRPKDT